MLRPAARETGFWRPQPDGELEVLITHATGITEIFYGRARTLTSWEMETDAVVRTASAKDVVSSHRLYGLVDGGDLAYVDERQMMGQPQQPPFGAPAPSRADPACAAVSPPADPRVNSDDGGRSTGVAPSRGAGDRRPRRRRAREPGELIGAQPGAGEPAEHVTEATAFVVEGGGEAVDALLAVLEVHGRADGAQRVVEEHGEQPVPGVAAPVGVGRVGRGSGRENVRDRGGDALARPGRRGGLAPVGGGPVIDGGARGAFVRSAVRRGRRRACGHRAATPAPGHPADRRRVGGHRAGNRPPRRPAGRRGTPGTGQTDPGGGHRRNAGHRANSPAPTSSRYHQARHRQGLGLAGRQPLPAGPTPGRVATQASSPSDSGETC